MPATTNNEDLDPPDLAVLKGLALRRAIDEPVKINAKELVDILGTSTQMVSRGIRNLVSEGMVLREPHSNGQQISITAEGEAALRREYEGYIGIFEMGQRTTLTGKATTGVGEGKHYVSLRGYVEQFRDCLGYEPYAGTLNVDLNDDSIQKRKLLETRDGRRIDEWSDETRTYGAATCYPVKVASKSGKTCEQGHVLVPDRTHYDADKLEVIAEAKLRDALDIDDGDTIHIDVIP